MRRRPTVLRRQRGVAVVTALLLTTLAITIVASLFWQQQVQVRSIENQRLQLQKQWILRGALDWARLILREDGRATSNDNLTEPWAVPLENTRLDQYVENGRADTDASDATLSGGIVDAQARFNLANLSDQGKISVREVEAFARLLSSLQLPPALAQETARMLSAAQARDPAAPNAPQPLTLRYAEDLLSVPGFTPEAYEKLKDYVIVLPKVTTININTASAEVIAAKIAKLPLGEAKALVAARQQAYFRTPEEFGARIAGGWTADDRAEVDVKTEYFIVNGDVRLNRASLQIQSLIERSGGSVKVIWIREN
jgi:general secretion pathway protein K